MASPSYLVKNASVVDFITLTKSEQARLLGVELLPAVIAAAGAACSVYILKGIFGEDVIGIFEELVGLIGGTVIAYKAGFIVFSFTGYLSLQFVDAFIAGALGGGAICLVTAFTRQIVSAIYRMWSWIMDRFSGSNKSKVEAVEKSLAKVVDNMFKAYFSVGTMVDKLGEVTKNMDLEKLTYNGDPL